MSPPATTRTAWRSSSGSMSLSRNPLAPARSASKTYSSISKVVSTMTRTAGNRSTIAAVAFDAVEHGHSHVHQHDVGPGRGDHLDGLGTVGCLTDHLQVVAVVEQAPEAGPHECLVVRQHHPDRHAVSSTSTGSRAATRKPPPSGRGPASSDPPAAVARSRMPATPCPRRPAATPTPSSTTSTVTAPPA